MKTSLIILTMAIVGTSFNANARVAREGGAEKVSKGSGTNIGGGNNGSEYLATWCRGQTSLLKSVRDRANLKLDNTGDYNAANKILNNGLVQALSNVESNNTSFLVKSLTRGLTIAGQLNATSGGVSERKAMATNHILNNYYDFIIEVVAKDLDLNAHIPFLESSEMDESAAHFEEAFVKYAHAQLQWILSTLVNEVRIGDKTQIVPVGDARSILKVALTLSGATAEDLEESLWNYRFSCSILDLKALNESLKEYDLGNTEMFEDEKQALTFTTKKIREISRTLILRDSCR